MISLPFAAETKKMKNNYLTRFKKTDKILKSYHFVGDKSLLGRAETVAECALCLRNAVV